MTTTLLAIALLALTILVWRQHKGIEALKALILPIFKKLYEKGEVHLKIENENEQNT